MNLKKNVLASVFVFVLCLIVSSFVLFPNKAFADIISGDYAYILNGDNTASITDYTGSITDVVIPNSLDGYTVINIIHGAFIGTNIESVVIPDSVVLITDAAFSGISTLKSIDLGEGVKTIDNSVFYGTSIESIIIPDSVITIGSGTFAENPMLTNVIIGNSVTTIGCNAFGNTGLKNVVIPDSVTSICNGIFNNSPLESIIIGSRNMATIDGGAFAGLSTLKDVTLRDGIVSIGGGAFASTGLTNVTIPSSVDSISGGAFDGIPTLTEAYFPDNAPSNMSPDIFSRASPSFTIYYISGKTGFDGAWNTYNTVALNTPTITTSDATAIIETGATLNGILTNNGGNDATIKFEYGTTEEYGTEIELDGEFTTGGLLTSTITGLTCGTTYHYNVIGTNFAGIGNGGDKTFTTSACDIDDDNNTRKNSRVIGSINPSILLGKKPDDIATTNPEIKNPITTPSFSMIYTRLLKQGTRGDDIKQIQTYLSSKGYILGLSDGIFGPKTKQAVISFQKANGLTPDGLIGKLTIAKMNELK